MKFVQFNFLKYAICAVTINFFLNSCGFIYDKADFIIPKEVEKDFSIILGESCGEKAPVINGRKQYKIKSNGMLIIQDEYEELPIDYRFFLEDENGEKKEIGKIIIEKRMEDPIPE